MPSTGVHDHEQKRPKCTQQKVILRIEDDEISWLHWEVYLWWLPRRVWWTRMHQGCRRTPHQYGQKLWNPLCIPLGESQSMCEGCEGWIKSDGEFSRSWKTTWALRVGQWYKTLWRAENLHRPKRFKQSYQVWVFPHKTIEEVVSEMPNTKILTPTQDSGRLSWMTIAPNCAHSTLPLANTYSKDSHLGYAQPKIFSKTRCLTSSRIWME